MMNLAKSQELFDPNSECNQFDCAVIGVGSVGSVVAENLARFGITKISLFDFDVVESKNIANQMFFNSQIYTKKVIAMRSILKSINPEIGSELLVYPDGYTDQRLSGYVFLCVDNIELRKKIVESLVGNKFVKGIIDFRTTLFTTQIFIADWSDAREQKALINSMDFTHAEATAEVPRSACHETLSLAPTIRAGVAFGISQFFNMALGKPHKKMIEVNPYDATVVAF